MPYWGKSVAPGNGATLVRLWWCMSPKHQFHPFPMQPQLQHNINQQGVVGMGGSPGKVTNNKSQAQEAVIGVPIGVPTKE